MAAGRISLAKQLAQLDQPAPVDFDPEDLTVHEHGGSDDEGRTTTSSAREHYFEVGPSSLRKLHDSIADPKYEGVKMSRKMLMEMSDVDEEGDLGDGENEAGAGEMDEEDDYDEEVRGGEDWNNGTPSESEDEFEDEEGEEEEEEAEEVVEETEEQSEEESSPEGLQTTPLKRKSREETTANNTLQNTLQKTREEDLRKGKAVLRQLSIWDCLLDARICMQKAVTTVNKVTSSSSRTLLESPHCQEDLQKYLEESILLAEDLFQLQETILTVNEAVAPPSRKKRRIQEDDDIKTYATYLAEASRSTASLEQALHPWLVQTLAKWSAKIQAVAPSVLLPSTRNNFSKNSQPIKSATQLVDEALFDQPRLLAKTRSLRGAGDGDGTEENPEVFNDTDFYQQMLRDVIESRGDGAGAAEDWVTLQREKKAKKKVDTKASKGRKLRYEVHEKLQNFMVPVPIVGAWHEEQVDELFASILGKGFEDSSGGGIATGGLEREKSVEFVEAIRDGFRVFG